MKSTKFILIYLCCEFLVCWFLSIIALFIWEAGKVPVVEMVAAGAGIQIFQITMRLLLGAHIIALYFVRKMSERLSPAPILSLVVVFHAFFFIFIASLLSEAENIIFSSPAVWSPIVLGIALTPFVFLGCFEKLNERVRVLDR